MWVKMNDQKKKSGPLKFEGLIWTLVRSISPVTHFWSRIFKKVSAGWNDNYTTSSDLDHFGRLYQPIKNVFSSSLHRYIWKSINISFYFRVIVNIYLWKLTLLPRIWGFRKSLSVSHFFSWTVLLLPSSEICSFSHIIFVHMPPKNLTKTHYWKTENSPWSSQCFFLLAWYFSFTEYEYPWDPLAVKV